MAADREWMGFVCPNCRVEQNFGPLPEPSEAAWERLFVVAQTLQNWLMAQCPKCRCVFPLEQWGHTTLVLPPER